MNKSKEHSKKHFFVFLIIAIILLAVITVVFLVNRNNDDDNGLEERINNALFESDQIKKGLQEDIKEIEDILNKDCQEVANIDPIKFNTVEELEKTFQNWVTNADAIIDQAKEEEYTSDNLTKLIEVRNNPLIEAVNIESLGPQLILWLENCVSNIDNGLPTSNVDLP